VPPHYLGQLKKVLKQLIREKLILLYAKTKYGFAYQLNKAKLKQIEVEVEIENEYK
jgi:hypothetical protein